ncbi:MAG: MFS transporter [Gammaproteobacteria bacterium]
MKQSTAWHAITSSSLGTILEWYDFSLFAFLTPVIAKLFFPQGNSLTSLMLAYLVFGIGFLVRPLGAMLFGHLGDRIGRKKTLIWSILLMSLPTFGMGLLPTYESIGVAAPILLILLRICQGLSAGGESTGAVLFVLESLPLERRGFLGSFLWSMTGAGMLLGSFAAMLVTYFADYPWAWRVPFIMGLVTGAIAFFLRRYTTESLSFTMALREKALASFPLKEAVLKYKYEMFVIIGLYALSSMITYLVFIFMPGYATNVLGMPSSQTRSISTLIFMFSIVLVPLCGYLSDRVDRKTCLRWSALGFIFLSYPLFKLTAQGSLASFVIAQCLFLLLAAGFQGPLTATVFEMLPTQVRYSITAVGYNVSYSVFGGTAPLVATFLAELTGNKSAPGLYLALGAIIAFYAINKMRTFKISYSR